MKIAFIFYASAALTVSTVMRADAPGVSAPKAPAQPEIAIAKAKPNVLPNDAAAAWKVVTEAMQPPLPPAEWNQKPPTEEEVAKFKAAMAIAAGQAADKAAEFLARFPSDTHASEARDAQRDMLKTAIELGAKERADELAKLPADDKESVAGGTTGKGEKPEDEAFSQRMQKAVAAARMLADKGTEAMLLEFEKQVRLVMTDFPDRSETYGALLEVAQNVGGEKSKAILAEIAQSKAPDQIKKMATELQAKMDRVGKPIALKYSGIDGREVDIAKLEGKVVLIDFWATWCGPCVAELPHVKEAYDKLHAKGFEIVGVSFDEDRSALEKFVKDKSMAWPQFFDGKGWGNKFGQEFGINSIPAMWLVDKKGVLRDQNAREELAIKVEKMLAE